MFLIDWYFHLISAFLDEKNSILENDFVRHWLSVEIDSKFSFQLEKQSMVMNNHLTLDRLETHFQHSILRLIYTKQIHSSNIYFFRKKNALREI